MRDDRDSGSRLYRWLSERIDLTATLGWLASVTGAIYGGLDSRLELRAALRKALAKPVPRHINWLFCFGGITFLLFLIQVVTGILLTLYYRPTPEGAYESVRHISNEVSLGWLIRGLHHWAANALILMMLLHMFRVFYCGAYKHPRELNWMVGVCLLMVAMAFGFTGYLLPWTQLSYWASNVGTELANAVPVVGGPALVVMRGGPVITGETLTRFYSAHVIILPVITVLLLAAHFGMIRRQGISGPL